VHGTRLVILFDLVCWSLTWVKSNSQARQNKIIYLRMWTTDWRADKGVYKDRLSQLIGRFRTPTNYEAEVAFVLRNSLYGEAIATKMFKSIKWKMRTEYGQPPNTRHTIYNVLQTALPPPSPSAPSLTLFSLIIQEVWPFGPCAFYV
jgi:hypothetical protein